MKDIILIAMAIAFAGLLALGDKHGWRWGWFLLVTALIACCMKVSVD